MITPQFQKAQYAKMDVLRRTLASCCALEILVVGNSMLPRFPSGSWVLVKPLAPGTLQPGACLWYGNESGCLVFHRLVERDGDRLLVRGDAEQIDDWIDISQIIGVHTQEMKPIEKTLAFHTTRHGIDFRVEIEKGRLSRLSLQNATRPTNNHKVTA